MAPVLRTATEYDISLLHSSHHLCLYPRKVKLLQDCEDLCNPYLPVLIIKENIKQKMCTRSNIFSKIAILHSVYYELLTKVNSTQANLGARNNGSNYI